MENSIKEALEDLFSKFSDRDKDLVDEIRSRIGSELSPAVFEAAEKLSFSEEARTRAVESTAADTPTTEARIIAETIVRPMLRPVLKVRDNTLVMEFFAAADSEVWRSRLNAAKTKLDKVIPAVGRIELKGHPGFDWVGTGWLIDRDVVVTNRHVAREFARRDGKSFVFRHGGSGPMTCRIDFLEEFERTRALEFSVSEVLWISPSTDSDIAFLRVATDSNGNGLTSAITLSGSSPTVDQFVATIGYPARDDGFPDQDLARRVFGDIYDKKRLAPGQVIESSGSEVLHDCSTFGGNSGSVVVDLESGEAVALHYAGLFPTAKLCGARGSRQGSFKTRTEGRIHSALGGRFREARRQ